MNNSFPRLMDGMIEALRLEVIPHTQGDFARGQAFGVIYMLEMMKRRAAWSTAFVGEQLAALTQLEGELADFDLPHEAGRIPLTDGVMDEDAMIAARDAGDAAVSRLIEWLAANPHHGADAAVATYLQRQLRHELTTSARPMFAEISLGRDIEKV